MQHQHQHYSLFNDVTYATRLATRLENFKTKTNNIFNFRCPLCGDSTKSKRKARGYLFPGQKNFANRLFFKCYNCNESMSFEKFLFRIDSGLAQEYRMGRFSEISSNSSYITETTDSQIPENHADNTLFNKEDFGRFCTKIENLNKDHFAYKYLIEQRKLPKEIVFSELYYTEDFKQLLRNLKTEHPLFSAQMTDETIERMLSNDPRVIIPFRTSDGNIVGFQGRTLNPNNKVRYITIKLHAHSPKVYGLNRLDTDREKIYVFEGPFDSMFIDNSLAVMDSDLTNITKLLPDIPKEKFVLVFDNEPRNEAIVQNMKKAIQEQFSIVIFSPELGEAYEKNKDINDLVTNAKIDPNEIARTLDRLTRNSNRSAGEALMTEMHFNRWKKIRG